MKKFLIIFSVLLLTLVSIPLVSDCSPHKYSITYILDGGLNSSDNVFYFTEEDEVILYPATKELYEFDGWADGSSGGTIINKIEKGTKVDKTLYARWKYVGLYNINYNLNGGENNPQNPTVFEPNQDVTLYTPTKPDYKFVHWVIRNVKYTPEQESGTVTVNLGTGSVLLTAIWSYVGEYDIVYDLNGGESNPDNPATGIGGKDMVLKPAIRQGYRCIGWKQNENSNPTFVVKSLEKKTMYLTAVWEKLYFINYELNGGENSPKNLTEVTKSDSFVLSPATKQGYRFTGWVDGDNKAVTQIPTYFGKDITLYATWEKLESGAIVSYSMTAFVSGRTVNFEISSPIYRNYINDGEKFTQLMQVRIVENGTGTTDTEYTFLNWYCIIDGRTVVIDDNTIFTDEFMSACVNQTLVLSANVRKNWSNRH